MWPFYLLLILIPTQLSKHFWTQESLLLGRRIDYLSPTLFLSDVVLLLLFVLLIFRKDFRTHLLKKLRTVSILSVFLLMQIVISSVKATTTYYSVRLFELWLLVEIVRFLKPSYWRVAGFLAIGVIYSVIIGIGQFLEQRSLSPFLYLLGERRFTLATPGIAKFVFKGRLLLRSYATFPHPNVFGGYLVSVLSFFIPVYSQRNKHLSYFTSWYMVKVTAILFSLVGIFISFSRSAWTAVLVLILMFLLWRRSTKLTWIMATIIGSGLLAEELIVGRFSELLGEGAISVSERVRLMKAGFTMFYSRPLFGVGLGGFIPKLPEVLAPPFVLQPAHSFYVLLFAETGIVGAVLFFRVIVTLIGCLVRQRSYRLLLPLFIIFFLGLADHYFYTAQQTRLLLALVIGMGFAATDR